VIVDAAFLKRWQRQLFHDLASESRVRFIIVDFVAATATLRDRITQRLRDPGEASDADVAVLEQQVQTQERLAPDELHDTVVYDAQRPLGEARLAESWGGVLARLAAAPAADAVAKAAGPAEGVDPGLAAKAAFQSRPA
jgi:predicted kinase